MQRHSSPSSLRSSSRFSRPGLVLSLTLLILCLAAAASAQPFGSWGLFDSSSPGNYFEIPHSPALNPTGQITIEGWVDVQSDGGGCSSIVGKNWLQAWWVGICGDTLRTYLKGEDSQRDGGDISGPGWHHFAVTFDGVQRCHYIDGKPPTCFAETGPLTSTSSPVRIGSDVNWGFLPNGAINEIRLWNVARSQDQIRSTINVPLDSPMPGLVAVWANGGPTDVVGPHDGVEVGTVPRLTFPVFAGGCTSTATTLCVLDRFLINVDYESPIGGDGQATRTNPSSFRSGLFWFFEETNWEVMVKVLDGCPVNDRYWVYSAATTDVFFRMEVFDQEAGRNKVYFNYAGAPAPAITDSSAFATCP